MIRIFDAINLAYTMMKRMTTTIMMKRVTTKIMMKRITTKILMKRITTKTTRQLDSICRSVHFPEAYVSGISTIIISKTC